MAAKSVSVFNLATGEERIYSGISAPAAVVAAYEQSRGNQKTWTYDYSQAKVSTTGGTVACGDWTAMLDKEATLSSIRDDKRKADRREKASRATFPRKPRLSK